MSVGGGSVVDMAGIPEALEQVRSALDAALDADAPRGLGDDDLLLALGALEGVGRLLDAHRAALAALPDSWERERPGGPAKPSARDTHAADARKQRKAERAARRRNRRR